MQTNVTETDPQNYRSFLRFAGLSRVVDYAGYCTLLITDFYLTSRWSKWGIRLHSVYGQLDPST